MDRTPAYGVLSVIPGNAARRLTHCGLNVFLDVSDLRRGYFDEMLLKHVEEVRNFMMNEIGKSDDHSL
jgi:hypothetical protein